MRKPIVERALELAGSGASRGLTDVKEALRREGYEAVAAYLDGRAIREDIYLRIERASDLKELVQRAKRARPYGGGKTPTRH